MTDPEAMRLNRFLARSGRGARRSVEEAVRDGLVTVNGMLVKNPGVIVKPGDVVRWDSERVSIPLPFAAVMNKPVGVETTMKAGEGRTVRNLAEGMPSGTSPVGRLDVRTGGLLLWSNDGDLTYRLTHPKWSVEREYLLILHTPAGPGELERIRRGSYIAPGQFSKPASVVKTGGNNRLRLVLTTGRNREVRRLCSVCGLNLAGLERVGYGPVQLRDLPRGAWRPLNSGERESLYGVVGLKP